MLGLVYGNSPLFQLDDVCASRGGRPVIEHATMDFPHAITCLVGPSGSGKSTLLRLLNRLADPDSGTIRFLGRDVRSLDVLELRRRAALVPQLPAPFTGTVAGNIAYGPRLIGLEANVPELLEQAALDTAYAEREADELSVGEQQRLMLARALALDPDVLLLDEPTSALDPATTEAIEQTFLDLRKSLDLPMILVTHDQAQAARLTEHTIRIENGKLVGADQQLPVGVATH